MGNQAEAEGRFSDWERGLLEQPAFAHLATLSKDGSPQLTVMWYRLVGDELRMITPAAAQKTHNLLRDPRAAMTIAQPDDPYRYVEMRGRIEVVRDPVRIADELRRIATRYIGDRAEAYAAARDPATRALLIFRPERTHPRLGSATS